MADLRVEFCGLSFKNPVVVASIEPTNSVDRLKKCIGCELCFNVCPFQAVSFVEKK